MALQVKHPQRQYIGDELDLGPVEVGSTLHYKDVV